MPRKRRKTKGSNPQGTMVPAVMAPMMPMQQAISQMMFAPAEMLNMLMPHNVLATLLTGGQYRTQFFSEESAASVYNPTQLYNRIPGVSFGYLKTEPYGRRGWIEPESDVNLWIYNNSGKRKTLDIKVNQLLCRKVATGGNFPCQYEPGYPMVYHRTLDLSPGGAHELKFKMYTPMISAKPSTPQQVGDVERVRVEVNVTDEDGNQARLAAMATPKLP